MPRNRPTTWDNIPEVFDYKYAAIIVGYHPVYLAKLIREGKFPGTKHGKKVLCTKNSVREWVERPQMDAQKI